MLQPSEERRSSHTKPTSLHVGRIWIIWKPGIWYMVNIYGKEEKAKLLKVYGASYLNSMPAAAAGFRMIKVGLIKKDLPLAKT